MSNSSHEQRDVSLKLIYDKKCVFHVLPCEKSVRLDMNLTIKVIIQEDHNDSRTLKLWKVYLRMTHLL